MGTMNFNNQDELVNHTSSFNIGAIENLGYGDLSADIADQSDYPEDDLTTEDDEFEADDEFGADDIESDELTADDDLSQDSDLGDESLTDDNEYDEDDSDAANPTELNS